MLVSWSQRKPLNLHYPPTRNPNASQWNIGVVGTKRKIFALAMFISCFLCRFHLRLVANVNTVFSGIWASGFIVADLEGAEVRTPSLW